MPPLRRHQLVHLSPDGWHQVLAREWDDEARACLNHWAAQALPLVVTRQPAPVDAIPTRAIAVGLPAPACWNRRRLALQVAPQDISWFGEFPRLDKLLATQPGSARPALQALCCQLADHGLAANVYGSAGWQAMTGLRYLHAASDLDLWIGTETAEAADLATVALQQHAPAALRLDGELMFPDGRAVAWREWAMWRDGQCAAVLVKGLHHARLEQNPALSLALQTWSQAA